MVIDSPRAFLSWSARMVIFFARHVRLHTKRLRLVRSKVASGHKKAPRQTEGQGKALEARDALHEYTAVSVVATIQATRGR